MCATTIRISKYFCFVKFKRKSRRNLCLSLRMLIRASFLSPQPSRGEVITSFFVNFAGGTLSDCPNAELKQLCCLWHCLKIRRVFNGVLAQIELSDLRRLSSKRHAGLETLLNIYSDTAPSRSDSTQPNLCSKSRSVHPFVQPSLRGSG